MAATLAPLPSALLALGPPSLMMLFAPVAAATNSTPTAAKATRGAVTATKTGKLLTESNKNLSDADHGFAGSTCGQRSR